DDPSGDLLVRMLEGCGVDTSHIVRKQNVATSTSILPIRPNGDRPALHLPGANLAFSLDDVHWPLIECAQYLHIGGSDVMRGLGSLMMTAGDTVRLAAHAIKVIDTSGCGDAYCAGFIRGLSLRWAPAECMRLGNAAAALVAQGLGSDARIESLEATILFMKTS